MKENRITKMVTKEETIVVSYTSDDGLYTSDSYSEVRHYEYMLAIKEWTEKVNTILCKKVFSKNGKAFQVDMLYEDKPELFYVSYLSPEEKEQLLKLKSKCVYGSTTTEFLKRILLFSSKENFVPLYFKKTSDKNSDSSWDCSAASKLLQEKRNIEETLRIMKKLEEEHSYGKD